MDHSGSLPKIVEYCPNAEIYTSPNGLKGLKAHYMKDWNFQVVDTGDRISIGKRTINFVLTPMVHWPDNMVSHCPEEKILFSNDAFGQHLATSERFDDEYSLDIIMEEARKYYANIVLPYSAQVQKALKAVSGLQIETICPSHGIIWRSRIADIVQEYQRWASNETDDLALIIYDTMWQSTQKMAYAVADAFEKKGFQLKMYNLRNTHISDIMTDLISAKYICVGSPTLNSNMLPTVASFLTYMRGLAPKNRFGFAFGSFGWGGQSIDQINTTLQECGFNMLPKKKIKYIPTDEDLAQFSTEMQSQL
jgi:flavorubredoxin